VNITINLIDPVNYMNINLEARLSEI